MKILIRVLLSAIGLVLAFALIDYYFNEVAKYILWGITTAVVLLYNEKKNREHKKNKDSNY
jgi:hypothetical protein